MSRQGSVFGASLLIAGTAIGGGMLALPVVTSLGGFLPAVVLYIACWLFMTITALLFVEVWLSLDGEPNVISMAKKMLGWPGKIAAWILYIFLFYCLSTAYVSGGGAFFAELFPALPSWLSCVIFVAIFAPFVFIGAWATDRINMILMVGLVCSYLVFVFVGTSSVQSERLLSFSWSHSLGALPVVFTSFAFQGFVPSLCFYLNRDLKKIRKAILIGSSLPLVVYIIWEALILGIVPVFGPGGLAQALENGETAVTPLKTVIQHPYIYLVGQFFAFFALVSSFLGVALGLLDFFADGFHIKKTVKGRYYLSLFVFVPPLLFALTNTNIFLQALRYAGGYGCALLLGLLPTLMVWRARYTLKISSPYKVCGGKPLLLVLLLFILFELIVEVFQDMI